MNSKSRCILTVFALMTLITLRAEEAPRMIEFGAWWAYYSIWFLRELPNGRVTAIEPDPNGLEVGRRNAMHNGVLDRFEVTPGAVGEQPGESITVPHETDSGASTVQQLSIPMLLERAGWDRVDLVLADIQGFETALIDTALDALASGRVRFLLISTHHHSISGDPLTHQDLLERLEGLDAHLIAEHTVSESFSGDGLIAVSFDDRDLDLSMELSRARAKNTIFGETEHDLAKAFMERDYLVADNSRLRASAEAATAEADRLNGELDRIRASRTWRWGRGIARLLGR